MLESVKVLSTCTGIEILYSFPLYLWASAYFSPFRFTVLLLVLIFSLRNQSQRAQPLLRN
jgi:hypothetical protein